MISPPKRLYSRNFTAALAAVLAAEAADQEVQRDQHGLEEHVEQQHVERDQRDQHHALDGQRQRQVGVRRAGLVAAVVPARDDQQRHQHGGQHHQGQGDAVEAEDVAGAERRDPLVVLDELVLRSGGIEFDGERHGDREHDQRDAKGDVLREVPRGRRAAGSPAPPRPSGRPTARSTTACRSPDPHHQDRRDQQRGTAEHRQGVRAGEPGLQLPQPFRRSPISAAEAAETPRRRRRRRSRRVPR